MRRVTIRDYEPAWAATFDAESHKVREALGATVLRIEHIGSTAVPGLAAKPTVDLMVEMDPLIIDPSHVDAMGNIDYEYRGEHGIEGRHYFTRTGFHVHVVAPGSGHSRDYTDFRDFLLANPAVAEEYASLKRRLAIQFRYEPDGYTQAKAPFIARTLASARGGSGPRHDA